MTRAVQVMPDGTINDLDGPMDLAGLQGGVGGGYIQMVPLGDGAMGWVDEEGKLKDQPVNPVATDVAHAARGIFDWDTINGIMLITGDEDADGNITDVPAWVRPLFDDVAVKRGGS